jgi:hypothetical protein
MNTKIALITTALMINICGLEADDTNPILTRKDSVQKNKPTKNLPDGVACKEQYIGNQKVITYQYQSHTFSIKVDKNADIDTEAYLGAFARHQPCACASKNPLKKMLAGIRKISQKVKAKHRSLRKTF